MAIAKKLIAPCGMNCALCMAYLREKNHCHGCRNAKQNDPATRACCRLRLCTKRQGDYCFNCEEFPCARLKHLDKRYRAKYEMSMIDNLELIRDNGIRNFIKHEQKRWVKGNKIYCVHHHKYFKQ